MLRNGTGEQVPAYANRTLFGPLQLQGYVQEFSRLAYVESSAGLTLLLCENATDIPSCLRHPSRKTSWAYETFCMRLTSSLLCIFVFRKFRLF